MDAKLFLEALEEIENEKHISKDAIIFALKEALKKAYIKEVRAADEADVRVIINEEAAIIDIQHVLEVVNDDDEEDKSLQISLSDANMVGKYHVGDEFIKTVDPESLPRIAALAVKSILRQNLSEVEKAALYETHKDKVGSLISGVVEKCDEKGAIVTIDRSTFTLSRKDLIADEMFKPGSPIQMFLSEVNNGQDKGPTLKLSRSDVGFLKCVIDEEVPDIHSGYVLIKNIVRRSGVRSKVAVYSVNSAVDPISSCLGKGSYFLKSICKRVSTPTQTEKVNFVLYTNDDLLYAAEALRPANILKIGKEKFDDNGEHFKIIAVVGNEDKDYATALGSRSSNLRLACELTGFDIEIIRENELNALIADGEFDEVEFVSVESLREQAKALNSTKVIVERAQEIEKAAPVFVNEGAYVKTKPQQILDEDIEDETPVVNETTPVVEEVKKEVSTTSPVVEEKPAEPAPEAPRVVKTTTTLENLEKSLETSKKKEAFKGNTKKRPHKITDDEVEDETKNKSVEEIKKGPQMDIYSAEELEEMENEDYEDVEIEEDVDYEEYEEYYEEN